MNLYIYFNILCFLITTEANIVKRIYNCIVYYPINNYNNNPYKFNNTNKIIYSIKEIYVNNTCNNTQINEFLYNNNLYYEQVYVHSKFLFKKNIFFASILFVLLSICSLLYTIYKTYWFIKFHYNSFILTKNCKQNYKLVETKISQ